MKCIELCDNFAIEGTDLNGFIDMVTKIAESTLAIPMETVQIELLPVIDADVIKNSFIPSTTFSGVIKPEPNVFDKDVACIGSVQDYFSASLPVIQKISLNQVLEKGGTKELFFETKEQSRLFIRYENQLYFTSPRLAETLCDRAKIRGEAVYDTSVERAAFIMRRFKNDPQTVVALVRIIPGTSIRKIMIMASERYQYLPQTYFKNIIDELGKKAGGAMSCRNWKVDSFISTLCLEFPSLAQKFKEEHNLPDLFIPGIRLTTSDTYDASLSACPTWRIGESVIDGPPIYMEHNGKASIRDFLIKIDREIFSRYHEFCKHLQRLQTIMITNPEDTISYLFSTLKITKAVGKKRMLQLIPEQIRQFQGQYCGGYDLVKNILQLPADCTLPYSSAQKLRRAVFDAVFLSQKQLESEANRKAG